MPTIRIPLEELFTDVQHPVDLTTLPRDEGLARVKEFYRFLPSVADISLTEGSVTVTLPEEDPGSVDAALRTYERAVRAAEGGKYRPAIRMLRDVLKVLPLHTDARRNLGMAHMETGKREAAKKHLIEVLRLDAKDAWAFLILGNLYARLENDLVSAERAYRSAYGLDPHDAYIVNSYAALKAKRGEVAEAGMLFEKAIELDPGYPNPRYGLALCHEEQGRPELALAALEGLFAAPESQDPRSEPVYEEARGLYASLNRRIAEQRPLEIMGPLGRIMDDFASEAGYPIDVQEDNTLSVSASVQLAWVHNRRRHVIKYKSTVPAIRPHRIAHEFAHIRLAHEARAAGRSRLFAVPRSAKEHALRAIGKYGRSLKRKGFPDAVVEEFMDKITSGLANQLFNLPVDMVIEHRLYHEYDFLRPSQVVSLDATQVENLQALSDEGVRDASPARVYRANIAMNCAYALFTDFLLNGATAYAEPYRKSGLFAAGRDLFEAWRAAMGQLQPGDEYDLVDTFAGILNLQQWYEWRPDEERASSGDSDVPARFAGVTDPQLLREKEPAVVEYCLDALRRFGDMGDNQLFEIAREIALLGRSGLDYASSEQKYTLESLPGERFSGLRLMCYMYVGLKRVEPSLETGLPFADAYAAALRTYQPEE